LSVAHEALFRVWDRLRDWLHQDRNALRLRGQIEEAAREWFEAERKYPPWSEERVIDTLEEIADSGVSLEGLKQAEVVQQFLGSTDVNELIQMLQPSMETDGGASARTYGEAWRLPLGHQARASAGVRLARLGDPRKGVGLRQDGLPDIDWCTVKEGGEVTIEIRRDPNDPNSEVIDTISQRVEPFSIARYPVTLAQFKAYLDACYKGGHWLTPPGFPVALSDEYPPPEHVASHPNHPADSINWWDAMAFCAWLSDRSGLEIRLPTEFEWQLAATGGDLERYIYPWGPEWKPQQEPWRANTAESRLNRSTAVGLYPHGASPVGALDMAGNLWEWCFNSFDEPMSPDFPASDEDRRVVRGGSWGGNLDDARAAYRDWGGPSYRSNVVGVRLVCSSPIL
jgi:formylglycine-generating enzyme required for sulfatase activity